MKHRIALAGNPNVGKSTIFNALTGLHQHTGNWPGKTVACTTGYFSLEDAGFSIVDLPGIYSFDVRSEEEAITRDYIAGNEFEFLLLVCDATCLERGLYLLKQASGLLQGHSKDTCPQIVLCVNLCDEAEKKGIQVNFSALEQELGIPVASCCARKKNGLSQLKKILYHHIQETDSRVERIGTTPSLHETPVLQKGRQNDRKAGGSQGVSSGACASCTISPCQGENCAFYVHGTSWEADESDKEEKASNSVQNTTDSLDLMHEATAFDAISTLSETGRPNISECINRDSLTITADIQTDDCTPSSLAGSAADTSGHTAKGVYNSEVSQSDGPSQSMGESGSPTNTAAAASPVNTGESVPDNPLPPSAPVQTDDMVVPEVPVSLPPSCSHCSACGSCRLHAAARFSGSLTNTAVTPASVPIYRRLPRSFDPKVAAALAVTYTKKDYRQKEEHLDRILTGPASGGIIMCLLLTGIFWLTITGANYPSSMLWNMFFLIETKLVELAVSAGMPQWFIGAFIYGVYRVVAWIISVMLPPMAIFFPLFTLLEDLGYLPRVAFNMDGAFHKCKACGKQCLTMAMGLGCNAAGVVGCRIIDSPRERLIAILTNSLVPCNGRFPLLLMMISLFMMGNAASEGFLPSLYTALVLTGFILAGVFATLGASWLLSRTLLKGVPSSFTLELPPYRSPQVGKVIVRSIFDRTLFVLGRAVIVAAPAGLIIWLMANISIGGTSLLLLCSGFLEPLGSLMGLDGIILMAFILGFPANEIVLPIILMAYLQSGYLVEMDDKSALLSLLISHGWTLKTAVCMAIFSLFHWPCSTTCLTVKKETGSLKWTLVAFLLPTAIGILLCILTSTLWNLF